MDVGYCLSLCCPQPTRCNLQLHYARPIAAGAVEASLSSLTTFAVRNPRGATCSCTTRDLLLQRLSKLRFHLSSFHFHLSSLTPFAVRNPRGATCSCTTRDLLLQRLSKLRFPLSSFIFHLSSFLCTLSSLLFSAED